MAAETPPVGPASSFGEPPRPAFGEPASSFGQPAPAGDRTASSFGETALLTPANAITIARLLLTPIWLVIVAARGASWASFIVGFVLAISDAFDGYIARRQGTTRSGAFLDPLADKFFVVGGLFVLAADGLFSWWPVLVITARELVISLFRSWAGRRGVSIPARDLAKAKTVVQEVAVGFAILPITGGHPGIAQVVLWAAVVLAVVTGAQYLIDGTRAAEGGARAV